MSTTQAPFGETFDSIEIAAAPNRDAIARALAQVAQPQEPGFYLVDDGGGRFVVDRALGIISLRDETILARERDQVHAARLCVIEPSGARYELEMKLRLTGAVPKMVGSEEIDFLAGAPAIDAPAPKPAPITTHWSAYSASSTHGAPAPINEEARFGAAFQRPLPPAAPGPYRLHLFTPLPPHADKTTPWSL